MKPRAGLSRNAKPRFRLGARNQGRPEMLTRQGRKSPVEPDEVSIDIDRALEDAGILDLNMTVQEKKTLYQALQDSKVHQVQEETQRLSLGSQTSPAPGSSRMTVEQNLLLPSLSRDEAEMNSPSQLLIRREPTEDMFSDAIESAPHNLPTKLDEKQMHLSPSLPVKSGIKEERRPGLSLGSNKKGGVGRGSGRGRAVPTKATKYSPLSLSGPGQNRSSSFPPSPQNNPVPRPVTPDQHSVAMGDSPPSPQKDLSPLAGGTSSPESSAMDSPGTSKLTADSRTEELEEDFFNGEAVEGKVGNSGRLHDLGEEVQLNITPRKDGQGLKDEEDVDVEVQEEEADDFKEPLQTVQMGNCRAPVSPFEEMSKPITSCSYLPLFDELEQFKGDEEEWMTRAKEILRMQRHALWDRILLDNPQWGPPIPDGGYNKQTLFKHAAPKYSKLFGSTSDNQGSVPVRAERQSKTQAMSKIQEVAADEWPEPEFHSLRRSKQKEIKREDPVDRKLGSSKSDPDDDDIQCLDDAAGSSGGVSGDWQSVRIERRTRGTSDPDVPSDLAGGSHSVYDFEDDMGVQTSNKNKKNCKRSGKSLQDDGDVEWRPSPRGRGSISHNSRGRSTKSRIQSKAIARPSEHATSSCNSRNKDGLSEQFEEEANARNNANSENRAWPSLNRTESENSSDISANKFYSPKGGQSRTTPPAQVRRNSRENQRTNDFPSSPGASGSMHGIQQDEVSIFESVPCPICNKCFPKSEIEDHAGSCFNYGGNGVGEELANGSQNNQNSNRTVEKADQASEESSEEPDFSECSKCNERFPIIELDQHMKECLEKVSTSSFGHKRGSSLEPDGGPAKKTSRFVE